MFSMGKGQRVRIGAVPIHENTNKLLKTKAKMTEKAVIEKYANVQGDLPSNILQEISQSMMNSDFPGQLSSASSEGKICCRSFPYYAQS